MSRCRGKLKSYIREVWGQTSEITMNEKAQNPDPKCNFFVSLEPFPCSAVVNSSTMGNNQSTSDMSCPSRRLCQILYLGTALPSEDSGEWFGVLPKERKQKKKSISQRNLTVMPVVPEVRFFCSIDIHDDFVAV